MSRGRRSDAEMTVRHRPSSDGMNAASKTGAFTRELVAMARSLVMNVLSSILQGVGIWYELSYDIVHA
jgi:hypothetical protein